MEYSMIPEIGHFALILALGVSIIQGVLPLILSVYCLRHKMAVL